MGHHMKDTVFNHRRPKEGVRRETYDSIGRKKVYWQCRESRSTDGAGEKQIY